MKMAVFGWPFFLGLNEDNFDIRWHKTLNSSPQIAIASFQTMSFFH